MFTIGEKIEKKQKIIVALFFLVFLVIGLFILKDYGISSDEEIEHTLGLKAINLIFNGDSSFFEVSNKYYGTAYTLFGSIIEKIFKLHQINLIFLSRHIWTFLLFYFSVICFYFLCLKIFKNWKISILGSLFLILSPQIFANSFYNPKDIPFLSAFIISIYTLVLFLEKKTVYNGLLHGLASAFLVGTRILGIIILALTFIFFICDLIVYREYFNKSEFKRKIFNFLVFLSSFLVFLLLFLPILWQDPIKNFIAALTLVSNYPWYGCMIFMGKSVDAHNLPWYYVPFYVVSTTPIFYTVLFLFGLAFFISKIKKLYFFYREERYKIIALIWFFLPIASVIILKSTLYSGWRQMFFIYPGFLIFSLNGIYFFSNIIKTRFNEKRRRTAKIIFIAIIIINLFYILSFFIRNHPYENSYFNIIAGKNMEVVKQRFDLDVWGLSYKQGLDYILKNDKRQKIKILQPGGPGSDIEYYLPESERNRIIFVDDYNNADYYMTNFRCGYVIEEAQKNVFFHADVNGTSIMVVYKLR